jgi:GNAT superfamily N-acetyltransferase
MNEIEIRQARRNDLAAIVAMLSGDSIAAAREDPAHFDDYVRAFAEIEAAPNTEIIVAVHGGEVVGTLQLTFMPGLSYRGGWRAEVEAVRVRDDLRNLRIGTRMMEWVIARARQRGCKLIQLTTNAARTDAQRFYRRLGFQASHVGMKLIL